MPNEHPTDQTDGCSDREGNGGKGEPVSIAGHVDFRGKPTKAKVNEARSEEHDGWEGPGHIGAVVLCCAHRVIGR